MEEDDDDDDDMINALHSCFVYLSQIFTI